MKKAADAVAVYLAMAFSLTTQPQLAASPTFHQLTMDKGFFCFLSLCPRGQLAAASAFQALKMP